MFKLGSRISATLLLLAAGFLAACAGTELPTSLPGYIPPAKGLYDYSSNTGAFSIEVLGIDGSVIIERNLARKTEIKRLGEVLYIKNGNSSFTYEGDLEKLWPLKVGNTV